MPQALDLVAPAYLWVPEHVSTAGGEVADLAESIGLAPYPEQQLALDTLLAERPDGKWAAFEGAVVASRQNIKTFAFKLIALADLYVFETRLVVWTAHEFSTAMESFRDVKELVTNWDHLRRRVRRVTEGNGEEGIELLSGQRLRFKARTISGGRGLTGDRVILDEAFALRPTHMGSLMPTMSALTIEGNPQILYGSSGAKATSTILHTVIERGRSGTDPYLAYVEWNGDPGGRECETPGCDHRPGVEGCLLDDRSLWARANILLGRRISEDFLAAERLALPPEEFAREILTWHDFPPADGHAWAVIDHDRWMADCDPEHQAGEPLRWALDVSPESRSAAVAISDGVHGEVMEHRAGTAWVVPWLAERKGAGYGELVLDAGGPAGALINELESAKIPYRKITIQEHAQACVGLLAAIDGGVFRHIGQEPLDAAAAVAERRTVVDVWLWTRSRSAGDICPLVAVTIAWWFASLAAKAQPNVW